MRKVLGVCIGCLAGIGMLQAQEALQEFTAQELTVIEAIKAQNRAPQETPAASSPMQAPAHASASAADTDIQLSEQAKNEAFQEQAAARQQAVQPADKSAEEEAALPPALEGQEGAVTTCPTIAFIDIDAAFNAHPRTQAVKKQIDQKIKSKQNEVQNAKEVIAALEAENRLLTRQLAELKPFYERIVTEQMLGPAVPESAEALAFGNLINRLLFAGTEVISTSPLNSPAQLQDITHRMTENNKMIAERSFFIDNYKYQTREEILKLEQEEVKAILQDIYQQIKSFAQKRNIGLIVRKDEILYGQNPVNATKDFINVLKKSKKYRKK